MEIVLLQFTNYYNRQIKRFDTLSEYANYVVFTQSGVNFNPRDGVVTEQIVNCGDDLTVNYLLAIDNGSIVSRWFVMDATRRSAGQYLLSLKRDLVADAYADVINAPMFIEKATLTNDNPLIFNSENMTYNQIKQSETLLQDNSKCAWIVGYMARTDGETTTSISGTVTPSSNQYISLVTTSANDFKTNNESTMKYVDDKYNVGLTTNFNYYAATWQRTYTENQSTVEANKYSVGTFTDSWALPRNADTPTNSNFFNYTSIRSILKTSLGFETPENVRNFISLYDGSKVKFSDGKVYKVSITTNTVKVSEATVSSIPTVITELDTEVKSAMSNYFGSEPTKNGQPYSYINYQYVTVSIQLTELIIEGSYTYSIPTTRKHLTDAPYDMFCMPYTPNSSETMQIEISSTTVLGINPHITFDIAQAISEQAGTKVYDIQLLPYCPIESILQSSLFGINISNLTESTDFTWIKRDNVNVSLILFPTTSSFSRTIKLTNPITITNVKVESECDMYRLCSPNYQGVFEFNAAKNGGVSSFNIDCTYLPYNPYIHIAPNFGRLYGKDFNDSRGLTCGGDFSLARVTDAWTNYQLNNKNYQASFNRQIQNMEFNNNISLLQDIVGAGTGLITSAGLGIMAGGPAYGIGASIVSTGAGIGDIALGELSRKETLDYTKDQFGYQLGNIKAQPDSLSKTTAYTANNKYFPYLEYYTCTDEEKQALINKLKYNGMTVMTIGTIAQYLNAEESYIKGQLIRLNNSAYDTHYVTELAKELNLGIFIKSGGN